MSLESAHAPQAPIDPLTGMSAARLGLYLHFPYCLSKCPYCDFASIAVREGARPPEEGYTKGMVCELELRLEAEPSLRGRELDSIFVGGGTPSLWSPRLLAEVLDAVAARFRIAPRAEVTLEANPGASDAGRFADYRTAGVNRLSIGVQSFEAETLRALGRAHSGDEAEGAFRAARRAGFDNLSLDFIYGVHGQSAAGAERDARRAVALEPEHLSAYALTLDRPSLAEEVPLARQLARGEVSLPPDEAVVEMAQSVREIYASAGLARYEISNYARPGFHSRHNALYWTGGEYLALGSGATGHWRTVEGGIRYANHRSPERYLKAVAEGSLPESSRETLSPGDLFEERLAMGLRLASGVDLDAVCAAFGEDPQRRAPLVADLLAHGLAARIDGRIRLTNRGAELHSEICARLL